MEDVLMGRNRNNSSFNQSDSMTHTVLTREIMIVTGTFSPNQIILLCTFKICHSLKSFSIFLI